MLKLEVDKIKEEEVWWDLAHGSGECSRSRPGKGAEAQSAEGAA